MLGEVVEHFRAAPLIEGESQKIDKLARGVSWRRYVGINSSVRSKERENAIDIIPHWVSARFVTCLG